MISFIRTSVLFLVATLMSANIASAQFTLTNTSLEGFFNTDFSYSSALSYDVENILPLLNTKGADQTWDFTGLDFDFTMTGTGSVQSFPSAAGTPGQGDDHYEMANQVMRTVLTIRGFLGGEEVEVDLIQYEYTKFNEEEFTMLGTLVMDYEEPDEVEMLIRSIPGELYYAFPVTYQSSWSSEFEEQVLSDFFDESLDYIVDVEVDGWGEIVTPEGRFEVLRVSRLRKLDFGFFISETLEVDFVNRLGIPIASLMVEIDMETGEYDLETAEASLNVFTLPTSGERGIADLPNQVTLHQNYPNPFNPSTQISYEIPEASHVRLEVFDMSGRRVAVLVDEGRPAGGHIVHFDADGLSSGVYVSRLQAGSHTVTRRMTLVK